MAGKKQIDSTDSLVIARIVSRGSGWVFTPPEFSDLGSSQAIRLALMRYERSGGIVRLARGIYCVPRKHPRLGNLLPSLDDIAKALQSRDASRLQPTGAYAANLLGLSEQVPVRIVFYTDGASKTVQVGKQQIVLKRRSTRAMATAGRVSGLVIQALEYLGREAVDDRLLQKLARKLSQTDLASLAEDTRYAPEWIADALRRLSQIKKSSGDGPHNG